MNEWNQILGSAQRVCFKCDRFESSGHAPGCSYLAHDLASQVATQRELIAALAGALPDPDRLELLADWLDVKYPDEPKHRGDVQYDLRSWAQRTRAALALATQPA